MNISLNNEENEDNEANEENGKINNVLIAQNCSFPSVAVGEVDI
ncbi:MAG: hypothetical protein ACLPP9_05880 [Smithella sp.]